MHVISFSSSSATAAGSSGKSQEEEKSRWKLCPIKTYYNQNKETGGDFWRVSPDNRKCREGRGGTFFGRTGYDGLVRGKRSFPPFLWPMANSEMEIGQLGRKSPQKNCRTEPQFGETLQSLGLFFTTADAAVVIFYNSPHPPHFLFCSRFSSGSAITSAPSLPLHPCPPS